MAEPAGVRLGSDVAIEALVVLSGHCDGEIEFGNGTLIAAHAQ